MGTYMSRGGAGFESALNSRIYVDKTDMIDFLNKCVNTESRYVCVTRPRRFGKTMTANMVAAYYDRNIDSRSMFVSRKLGQLENWDRYLNAFHLLQIDLAGIRVREGTGEKALAALRQGIRNDLLEVWPELFLPDESDIATMLELAYQKTHIRFVVLIDEWDCLFREEKNNLELHRKYIDLLRSLFKDNRSREFLALAYLTGILPIRRYNSESSLNNFTEYTMLQPRELTPWIGFTMDEVRILCEQYQMDYGLALEWYDGYQLKKDCHVCSPNSVVQAMMSGDFACYWSQTSAFSGLAEYITMNFDGLKEAVVQLLGGQRVPVSVEGYNNGMNEFHDKDQVLTMLVHLGFLGYDREKREVYIPNKEVRMAFEFALKETHWDEIIRSIQASARLLQLTLMGESEAVAETVDAYHRETTSILTYNDENALACCITIAYYAAVEDYHIYRELPAGYGFADIVMVPKRSSEKPALVIELKWNHRAETAIQQIKNKHYPECLKGWSGDILMVGISYQKNSDKKHHCVIEWA